MCPFEILFFLKYFPIWIIQVSVKIDEILRVISAVLPVDGTINILNPVIATGEFPTNLCAIKLLLELVSNQSDQITDAHIDSFMPNIAKVTLKWIYLIRSKLVTNEMVLFTFSVYWWRTINGTQSGCLLYCSIVCWIRWRTYQTEIHIVECQQNQVWWITWSNQSMIDNYFHFRFRFRLLNVYISKAQNIKSWSWISRYGRPANRVSSTNNK